MKQVFILIFLICYGSSSAVPSDSLKVKRKKLDLVFKTDLLGLTLSGYGYYYNHRNSYSSHTRDLYYTFMAEVLLLQNQSIQLTYTGYNYSNNYGYTITPLLRNWFVIAPEYKFFVSKKRVCSGYYVGASLKYIHLYNQTPDWNGPANYTRSVSQSVGAGFINGVQFYVNEGFTFDFVLGVGFFSELNYSTFSSYPTSTNYYYPYYWRSRHAYDLSLANGSPSSSTYLDLRLGLNIGYRF